MGVIVALSPLVLFFWLLWALWDPRQNFIAQSTLRQKICFFILLGLAPAVVVYQCLEWYLGW